MATASWKISEVEIIGYADVLEPTMLPAVVPPVFRLLADKDQVLLPPYSLQFEAVVRPTVVSMAEAEHLRSREQIHLFANGARKAEPGHQMWLRRDGQVIYQPVEEARRALDQLSEEALQRAIRHFKHGRLDLADDAASEAILSNDRQVDAYAIKAAIRRKRGDLAGERLMAELAEGLNKV